MKDTHFVLIAVLELVVIVGKVTQDYSCHCLGSAGVGSALLVDGKVSGDVIKNSCPITDCENKVNPEHTIEFTIPDMEDVIKISICDECYAMASAGWWYGFILTPKVIPAQRSDYA